MPGLGRGRLQLPLLDREHATRRCKQRVEAILKKHGLDYSVDWVLGAKPFLSKRGRLAQTRARRSASGTPAARAELSTTGGTSDARFIIDICPEVRRARPGERQHPQAERAHRARRARAAAAHLPGHAARPASLTLARADRDDARSASARGAPALRARHRQRARRGRLPGAAGAAACLSTPISRRQPRTRGKRSRRWSRRRIEERIPAAYLLQRSLARRACASTSTERVIVPRSHIADPAEGPARRAEQRVLDLCTGSGCLAVLAARAFPRARVDACRYFRRRARGGAQERRRLAKRIRLVQSDLFEALAAERFDLIVSNPPYVAAPSMRACRAEYRHEPRARARRRGATASTSCAASSRRRRAPCAAGPALRGRRGTPPRGPSRACRSAGAANQPRRRAASARIRHCRCGWPHGASACRARGGENLG